MNRGCLARSFATAKPIASGRQPGGLRLGLVYALT